MSGYLNSKMKAALCAALIWRLAASAGSAGTLKGFVKDFRNSPHGDLELTMTPEDFRRENMDFGDMVSVRLTAGGKETVCEMPLVKHPGDVDAGAWGLRLTAKKAGLFINYGSFAEDTGLAEWDGSGWRIRGGRGPIAAEVTLIRRGSHEGPSSRFPLRFLARREDCPSDEAFANFREVRGGRLGRSALFRSASPSRPEMPRAVFADRLMRQAGVRTVLNLADTPRRLEKNLALPAMTGSFYGDLWAQGGVISMALPAAFTSPQFREGLREELRFASRRPGPFLVHCTWGKDRAGLTAFLLAALCGASKRELEADYSASYENYYGVKKSSEAWQAHVAPHLAYFYSLIGAGEDVTPEEGTSAYLKGIGLTDEDLRRLRSVLQRDWS